MSRALPLAIGLALGLAACPDRPDVGHTTPPPDGTVVTDPVSRTSCTKGPLTPAAVLEEKTYYFCCDDCPKRFAASPEAFL